MRDFGYSFPFLNWLWDGRDVFGHTHGHTHTAHTYAHTHAHACQGPRGDDGELWQWEVKPTLLNNIQPEFSSAQVQKGIPG